MNSYSGWHNLNYILDEVKVNQDFSLSLKILNLKKSKYTTRILSETYPKLLLLPC